MYDWEVHYVEFDIVGPATVEVTAMHWKAHIVDGTFHANQQGSFFVPVVVPEPKVTMEARSKVDWVTELHTAMGAPAVAAVENALDVIIAEQKVPTEGGFIPGPPASRAFP